MYRGCIADLCVDSGHEVSGDSKQWLSSIHPLHLRACVLLHTGQIEKSKSQLSIVL